MQSINNREDLLFQEVKAIFAKNICGNYMKRTLRLLFIGIALCFFFGNIISHAFLAPKVGEPNFGTWSETAYFHQITLEWEEDTFSEPPIPSPQNIANTLRYTFKSKRTNHPSSYQNGFYSIKGKEHKNYYNSHLFNYFSKKISSGLNEARHNLISFGRLII